MLRRERENLVQVHARHHCGHVIRFVHRNLSRLTAPHSSRTMAKSIVHMLPHSILAPEDLATIAKCRNLQWHALCLLSFGRVLAQTLGAQLMHVQSNLISESLVALDAGHLEIPC